MRSLLVFVTVFGFVQQSAIEPHLVGGDISKPNRTKFVQPEYPPEAQANALQSIVILQLTVSEAGAVMTAVPLRGDPAVTPAAVAAAEQWEYEPTLVDGKSVAVRFSETVLFMLRKPVVPEAGRLGGNGMFLRPPTPGATTQSYRDWELKGEAFTCCPCDTPCPCRSNAAPSHPPCHAATAQHFYEGHYGEVDLAGVSFVTLGPEHWTAIYFDEQMSEAQQQAILDIYASMVPGAPQVYRSVQSVPIQYSVSEDGAVKRVQIPNILEMASRAPLDAQGGLSGELSGMDVWSNRIAYGENLAYRYADASLGEAWDHSGRQSNHKVFHVTKRHYDDRLMLIQHGDGSGDWTDGQRAISCPRLR